MSSLAIVACVNNSPTGGGGGLGVARIFFEACLRVRHTANSNSYDLYGLVGSTLVPAADEEGLRNAISAPLKSGNRPAKWYHQARLINSLTERYQRVVVIAFTPFMAGPMCRRSRGVRIIHTEHSKGGLHNDYYAGPIRTAIQYPLRKLLTRDLIGRAETIVFPSTAALNLFLERNPEWRGLVTRKAAVVHNSIRSDVYEELTTAYQARQNQGGGRPAGPYEVLGISINTPIKGLDIAVQAIAELGNDFPFRYTAVGQRTMYTETLEGMARNLNVSNAAVFAGTKSREETDRLLGSCDIFVHTPRAAVFDLVLLEAMAAGLPVIASRVGGNTEALGEHYEAYAERPSEVASLIKRLARDRVFAKRVGEANRRRFEQHFYPMRMYHEYIQVATRTYDRVAYTG